MGAFNAGFSLFLVFLRCWFGGLRCWVFGEKERKREKNIEKKIADVLKILGESRSCGLNNANSYPLALSDICLLFVVEDAQLPILDIAVHFLHLCLSLGQNVLKEFEQRLCPKKG